MISILSIVFIVLEVAIGSRFAFLDLAEKMLGMKYNSYRHATSDEEVVRTLSYSIPKDLHDHIDVIVPSTYFGTVRSMKVTSVLQPTPSNMIQDTSVPAGMLAPSCNTTIHPCPFRFSHPFKEFWSQKAFVITFSKYNPVI